MASRFRKSRRLALIGFAASICTRWPGAARAGSSIDTPVSGAAESWRLEDTATHVHIVGVARISGEEDELAVTLRVDPGFHINANPPSSDFLIPTVLTIAELQPLRIAYPTPVRFKPKFTEDTIVVYDGMILITAFFPKGALSSFASLHGSVTAQACTDRFCLPPADILLPPS